MKRYRTLLLLSLTLCGLAQGLAPDHAQAALFRRRAARRSTISTVSQPRSIRPAQIIKTWRTAIRPDDQAAAEKKAETQQATDTTGHIGQPIGDFEGTGWSKNNPQPTTCTPPDGMTLTADATKCGANGCFRVRSWRRNP